MFGFIKGLTETVIKTAVGLPVAAAADILTAGGELTDKPGQTYTGDMLDSIDNSLNKMTE